MAIEAVAARWVSRTDRGLTAAEQDEFLQWLAADPRHQHAWVEQRKAWEELDRLGGLHATVEGWPDPDLLKPRPAPTPRSRARRLWPLAAVAALVLAVGAVTMQQLQATRAEARAALTAPCDRQILEDGSVVELNRAARIEVRFTAGQRRVRLVEGEAAFKVEKDAGRPFIVEAGEVTVRAIGTAFNVKLERAAVDVVVAEGTVDVAAAAPQPHGAGVTQRLNAAQRVVVPRRASAPPTVSVLDSAQLEERLAWRPRMLDFSDSPLAEVVAGFNERNAVKLTIGDPSLTTLRLNGTFRSDNLEAFLRLMRASFRMRTEWRGDDEIVLLRAP